MAYYNEIFVEDNDKLVHIGSCTGSDTPSYFFDVRNLYQWKIQLEKLQNENGFYPHSDKYPFPWKTYKQASDNLIVLRKTKRKWFEFWKPSHQVWVSVDKYDLEGENESYFIQSDKWCGDVEYSTEDLIILNFPLIIKN